MTTTHELQDMFYLGRLIDHNAHEIERIEWQKTRCKKYPERVKAYDELLGIMKEVHTRDIARYEEIKEFINSIPDEEIKQAITLHYARGLTWFKVERKFYYAEGTLRKNVQRYMKKVNGGSDEDEE